MATYDVDGLSIRLRELLVIHRSSAGGRLMIFKSRCKSCTGCGLLQACTSIIKDVAREFDIDDLRGGCLPRNWRATC